MVIPSYYPIVGGAEQQLFILTEALAKNGQLATVVTRKQDSWPRHEMLHHTQVYRLPSKPYPVWFLLHLLWFLINRKTKYQLIHVHTLNSPFLLCAYWGRIFGIPVLAKVTGTGRGSQIASHQASPVRRWLFSAAASCVAGFIATTKEVEAILQDVNVPNLKIYGIPNGVTIPPHVHKPTGEIVRICYVGRLIPSKRMDWLIRCVAELREEGRLPHCEVNIIGDGEARPRLEKLVEETGLSDVVTFWGMLGRDMVQDLLNQQDCFVLPSEREGLSNALLEAMALGLVAIAADIPANRAVIEPGENGFLFTGMAELKACIAMVFSDPTSARALARNGRAMIERKFSMEQIVPRYIDLYQSLTGVSSQTAKNEPQEPMAP